MFPCLSHSSNQHDRKPRQKTVTIDIRLFIYTFSGFFGNVRQFRGVVSAFIDWPLWKMSIFWHFLKLLFFWSKKHSFLDPKYHKKRSFLTCFAQKTQMRKKFDYWTKTIGLTSLEIVDLWHFFKLLFSGLKGIFFYPEYHKKIFSDLIWTKR